MNDDSLVCDVKRGKASYTFGVRVVAACLMYALIFSIAEPAAAYWESNEHEYDLRTDEEKKNDTITGGVVGAIAGGALAVFAGLIASPVVVAGTAILGATAGVRYMNSSPEKKQEMQDELVEYASDAMADVAVQHFTQKNK